MTKYSYVRVNLKTGTQQIHMEECPGNGVTAQVYMLQRMNQLNSDACGQWQYYTNLDLWDDKQMPQLINKL